MLQPVIVAQSKATGQIRRDAIDLRSPKINGVLFTVLLSAK